MANEQNLIPFDQLTESEQREIRSKGGIASGKARRKKASLMRCAKRVLESDLTPNTKRAIEQVTGELDDENDTIFTAAVAVMAKEALNGNVSAFRELKDIVRDIENTVVVNDSIEDDTLSASLEEIAKNGL